jgi:hypothetical protein
VLREEELDDLKKRLVELRRRLANAKQRAKYWAGLPSFVPGAGNSMTRLARERLAARGSDHEQEYEMAMCDVGALADEIERVCGKRPVVVEYKTRAAAFGLLIATTQSQNAEKA